ncbi:DUF3710 domain-containing protein [Brevibacterium sp. NPDC056947]|uniref:DUF3710 domain-containing protein n=1 Tax=Brevibacterium sp. NPDC056947 TaxID=3345974 RepID=UPI003629A0C8
MGLFSRFSKKSAAADEESATDRSTDEEIVDDELVDEDVADDHDSDDDAEAVAETEAETEDLDDEAVLEKSAPLDRAEKGPFDAAEDYPELNRLDLGALKVPVVDGMQIRLDTDDDSQRVLAVTLIHDGGGVQLQAFATPRSEGLWNTVRRQLTESVESQGGECTELHTGLGRELAVEVPAKTEDGRPGKRAMRFAGVDGPRWFVRAVVSGKAVTDAEVRAELSALVRGVVVDRGDEAMAPRELIALTAPEVDAAPEPEDETEDINPFARGPEITEVR